MLDMSIKHQQRMFDEHRLRDLERAVRGWMRRFDLTKSFGYTRNSPKRVLPTAEVAEWQTR